MRPTRFGAALVAVACFVLAPSMVVARAAPGEAPASASSQDRSFLLEAIEADTAQITLGRMAERGGPAINDLGVMIVQERHQDRDQAVQLAKAQGLVTPDHTSREALREHAKLERLSGPEFNYAFVNYMISADRKAIKAYRREAQGHGPVAELARSTLPSLLKQLRVAIGLAQQEGA